MVLLANPFAVELSVWMGERGCGHFIYFSVCRIRNIALTVMKSPSNSASEAEDMTMLIIWARERTGPLSQEIGSLSKQEICDPARLRARVSLRYAASECAAKTMLLAL